MKLEAQNGNHLSVKTILTAIFSILICHTVFAASTSSPDTSSAIITQSDQQNKPAAGESTAKPEQKDPEQKDNAQVIDESSIPELSEDDANNKDPLERINRAIFMFNDKLDYYLIKPVAELYNDIVPRPMNKGIHNFFNNLGEVPTIINDFLQFNFFQGFKDIARLSVNSTIGIGGIFDIATRMHLPYFQNDFGLTLARWGYGNSSYLVLPFFGSNTIRDGVFGLPVDYFEFSVYPYITPQSTRFQILTLFMVDHRANLLQFEPVLEEAAIDRYVFMRNAYMQHRAFQIEQVKHLSYKEHMQDKDSAGGERVSQ